MSHIRIAVALCAGLVLYPGGVSAAVGMALVRLGPAQVSSRAGLRRWLTTAHPDRSWVYAGLLCSLVVLPLPWGGSPISQLQVGGVGGAGIGGLALSVLGLLVLESRNGGRMVQVVLIGLVWALGLVAVAVTLRAATWSELVAAGGVGAELARLGLGLSSLALIPWAGASHPGRQAATAAAAAARLAVSLSLLLPQLQALAAGVDLVIWWGVCVIWGWTLAGGVASLRHRLGGVPGWARTGRM